jgi:hypothetical protein
MTKRAELPRGLESLYLISGDQLVEDPIFLTLPSEQQELLLQVLNDPSHPVHEKRRWHLEMDEVTSRATQVNLSKIKGMKQDEFDTFIASRDFGYTGRPAKFVDDKAEWFRRVYETEKANRIPNIALCIFLIFAVCFGALFFFLD